MQSSIQTWDRWQSAITLLVWLVAFQFDAWWLLFWTVALSFVVFVLMHWREWGHFKPYGGYPNYVTAFRLGLVFLLAILFPHLSDWQIALWAAIVIALDGVDGMVARYFVQESYIGAYFDMESDVVYVLAMSTILYLTGKVEAWIFIAALLRYFYILLIWVTGGEEASAKGGNWARWVAGTYFGALIVPFLFAGLWVSVVLVILNVVLLLSFSKSFYEVWMAKQKSI
jgi:phosphatidylglycerophosphate synthase